MITPLHWILTPGPGRLAVMPRPRGGEWLEDEIRALKESGVGILVSLLEAEEETLLGLEEEAAKARAHGMEFVSHPVPDRSTPPTAGPTWALARALAARFAGGAAIAAHCRMGIGRSPLLLACVLVSAGFQPEEAWTAIGDARGCVVPDTIDQRLWLTRTAPRRLP